MGKAEARHPTPNLGQEDLNTVRILVAGFSQGVGGGGGGMGGLGFRFRGLGFRGLGV